MSKNRTPGRGKRFLVRLVSALLILVIVLSAFGVFTARRSFPQSSQAAAISGAMMRSGGFSRRCASPSHFRRRDAPGLGAEEGPR